MGRQLSGKRGLQSTARKQASTRHGTGGTPATRRVPGAFGKERGRRPATRAARRTGPRKAA
jgi:hypothetical protein